MYSCYSAEGESWHKRIYIQCSVVVQLRGGDMYSCYSAEGESWHKHISTLYITTAAQCHALVNWGTSVSQQSFKGQMLAMCQLI